LRKRPAFCRNGIPDAWFGKIRRMKRTRRRPWWIAAAITLLCVLSLALWQSQALARLAIMAGVEAFAHVRIAFGASTIATDGATFRDIRVTSFRNEPIARIARLVVVYDLHDFLPGGKRRFGLKSVELDSPQLTIIRRPDGTYNVPVPHLQANSAPAGPPLIARARLRNGSVDVIDESAIALPQQRHLFVRDLQAVADISTQRRSTYTVTLRYGESCDRLDPVHGNGVVDVASQYIDQRWSAPELPIAAAVDFITNSSSFRVRSGRLENVDLRYFGIGEPDGSLAAHLAGSATLAGGRISVSSLSQPIASVGGPVDVYDDGLLTPRLDATIAGVPARVSGGIYGLGAPRMRVAVSGSGDLAQLRRAFAQAGRLPMHGPLQFALLAEGPADKPIVWIDLRSPATTYASATLHRLNGVLAFDGHQIEVVNFGGEYAGGEISARGRISLQRERNALEMLVGVKLPANEMPYVSELLPGLPFDGEALATADDLKTISLRGMLWGDGPSSRLQALFDVDNRGVGSIGPLAVDAGGGSLYARIALDQPHHADYGIVDARAFPFSPARGTLTATLFGGGSAAAAEVDGVARLANPLGGGQVRGSVGMRNGMLHGSLFGGLAQAADFGATVAGTARNPRITGTVVVAGGRYRNFAVNGNAGFAFERDTLHVRDAAVAVGPLFLGVAGTVENVLPRGALSPSYDLTAQVHSSDVGALMATVAPRAANLVAGSLDADVSVRGSGTRPSFAGTIDAPEGSVNGLAFRQLQGDVAGNTNGFSLTGGHVVIGSSPIALNASAAPGSADVAIDAPRLDLADFNDFFDAGDMFAGTGSLAMRASVDDGRLTATSGDARFTSARFRRIELGRVAARWTSSAGSIASRLRFGGPSGEVAVAGRVAPTARYANLVATARGVDLGTWLPMLGLNVPITGHLDADTTLAGIYPNITMGLKASVYNGTAGRMPIQRFEVAASAAQGRGRIESAALDVPFMTTVASGSFGLSAGDPLALTVTSKSPNIGAFLNEATGKDVRLSGGFASTLHVAGTRDRPVLRDAVVLQSLQYANFTIPRIAGEIDADRDSVALRSGEIDFDRGKAFLAALAPLSLAGSHLAAGSGPIAGSFVADDVELSNFAPLLPKGTQLGGRIDGRLQATGTRRAPAVHGALTLRDGTFSAPIEKSPITGVDADLSFARDKAQLRSHAFVGGGAVTASAVASLSDLQRPADATFTVEGRAQNARFDVPAFFQGTVNGAVTLARQSAGTPTVGGNLSIYNARIPLTAFLAQKAGAGAPPAFNVAFDNFNIAAGPNVRVQSANVDVGATGAVRLGGTLAAPTLAGEFNSTGGSLSFYRNFNVERGNVTFDPAAGLIPDIDAVATTYVPNPATAVRLHVTGPATDMNLSLASEPPYSKEQILGLLVGAQQFGAVQGVQSTGGSSFSAGAAAQNVAFGQLNTVFTRNLLEPLNTSLGNALGFTEVQITSDIQTGLGVNAVKAFGKFVNAIWSESFGYPRTQAVALEAHPDAGTGLRLTAYSSEGPTLFALEQQPTPDASGVLNLSPLTSLTPMNGQNGVTFQYQRKFP
jgi:hypothetical protein